MQIIPKRYDEVEIIFSLDETIYLNATQVAKKFHKKTNDWTRLNETQKYIDSVENRYGIPRHELLIKKQGGKADEQGTWIHRKLIIAFARWLSSDFAVWCDLQIEEILKSKNSQPNQPVQTSENFDLDSYISENEKLIKLIKIITSESAITLHYLDKLTRKLNLKSSIDLLEIDLNSYYFIPTELGKFFNKSAVEVNKILEKKGFQEKINGVWVLTEQGKKYAIQLDNKFSTIKWKLEAIL